MTVTLFLVLALSVVIGLSLGVLGGGGSILTVPILVYVAGFEAKEAIAASLFVVGVTSAVSVISHARGGRVMWRTGLIFGAAGMAGAFVGGLLGGRIPGQVLLIAFALMMVATSSRCSAAGKRPAADGAEPVKHELPRAGARRRRRGSGHRPGSAGGGFLAVPALALLGGLSVRAVGTSLVVIAMKSFAGLAGYLTTVHPGLADVPAVTAAAIVGTLVGSKLAGRIPETALRKAHSAGSSWRWAPCPDPTGAGDLRWIIVAGVAALAVTAAGICWFFVNSCPLRKNDRNSAHRSGQHSPA
ncbi:MAG: sulfite exporter TauE/SafE family protein [Tessaracoccus sp.]